MTFFSRITVSERIILDSRPEHLKTSNASLSIPGFQRSHHAPSGPAGQGCWTSTKDGLKYLRRQLLEAVILLRRRRTGIMIFLELMASESFKGATNIERNGIKGSDLMVFSFATIVAATINFAIVAFFNEIDQLSMILSTISDASRLRTSGVAIVRGDMPCKDTCLQVSRKREREPEEATKLASPENKSEKEEVEINPLYPDQKVIIGTSLPLKLKEELQKLLRANQDIFAWSPLDMTGIPRELAEHKLNIHPSTFPVRQKKRVLAERNDAVNQEVIKLVKAIILKEVYSPRWVANPVMIRMAEEDEEKTAFYTEHGTFCYEKMPFGLRNAGATYQRLVDKAFSSQLGRNIEIYVDDMAIKSRNVGSLIADIEETFHTLRRINMKLNLKNVSMDAWVEHIVHMTRAFGS
ncbi:hypothetical protein Tco_0349637 [Tanacetum coccineum]